MIGLADYGTSKTGDKYQEPTLNKKLEGLIGLLMDPKLWLPTVK